MGKYSSSPAPGLSSLRRVLYFPLQVPRGIAPQLPTLVTTWITLPLLAAFRVLSLPPVFSRIISQANYLHSNPCLYLVTISPKPCSCRSPACDVPFLDSPICSSF